MPAWKSYAFGKLKLSTSSQVAPTRTSSNTRCPSSLLYDPSVPSLPAASRMPVMSATDRVALLHNSVGVAFVYSCGMTEFV